MQSISKLSLVFVLAAAGILSAQPSGIEGLWVEPTGSVIRVDHCGGQICLWVVSISHSAPSELDIFNPDPAKRARPVCGMKIGSGFEMHGTDEASNGTLYDPKSGKTYHGAIRLDGGRLQLRGYVGIPLFGETQTWTRPTAPVKACSTSGEGTSKPQ